MRIYELESGLPVLAARDPAVRASAFVEKEQGVADFPDAKLAALVGRMQDIVLAHMPVQAVLINKQWTPEWADGPEETAYGALTTVMRHLNAAAAAKMSDQAAYFTPAEDAARAPLRPAVGDQPPGGLIGYQDIRKPGDVSRFVIKHHVANAAAGAFMAGQRAFQDIGVPEQERHHLKVAVDGYLLWVLTHLAFDLPPDENATSPGMLTQLVRAIKESATPGPTTRSIPAP